MVDGTTRLSEVPWDDAPRAAALAGELTIYHVGGAGLLRPSSTTVRPTVAPSGLVDSNDSNGSFKGNDSPHGAPLPRPHRSGRSTSGGVATSFPASSATSAHKRPLCLHP